MDEIAFKSCILYCNDEYCISIGWRIRIETHLCFDASTDARPVGVWLQLDSDVLVVRTEHETRLVVALRHHLRSKQGHHMK